MKSSLRLFRIAGIDIGIHYTWVFVFILITFTLAEGVFNNPVNGFSPLVRWVMGGVTAISLFISVLLHELAHSLVAKARGLPVSSITLFIFGGVSNLEEEPEKPGIEFIMAIVGPGTSLVLGVIFWIIAIALTGSGISFAQLFTVSAFSTPLEGVIGYLALTNILLAVFNLLPGFPLDGGRVLRSIIWGATGNLKTSTNIAGVIGQFFGWAFIAWGVYSILGGNFIGGLWIAFIGWFLMNAADSSRKEVRLRERLAGFKVKDVMNPVSESVSLNTTVAEVVDNIFRKRFGRAVPVCDNDKLAGVMTISDVRKLPRELWTNTQVEKIMTKQPLYVVSPEDGLQAALKLIAGHDINQVLVARDGKCVGMLSRAEIIAHLQLAQDLGISKG